MIHLTWRQFRAEAVTGLGALIVVAVVLVVTGPHIVAVYRTAPDELATTDHGLQLGLQALLLVAPALVGVFYGAPLIARELESGTFRLAWTQSVTRTRWLATKLAVAGAASSLLAGGLSLMVAWWANPINIVNQDRFSPMQFGVFGIVPFAYALFAFSLGATTGLLFKKTLPAFATTLVGYAGARLAVTYWVRPHFARPLTRIVPVTASSISLGSQVGIGNVTIPNAWVLSSSLADRSGRAPSSTFLSRSCPGLAHPVLHVDRGAKAELRQELQHCVAAIAAKFHGVVTYQPAGRYWGFQGLEAALFVLLALALAGASFWWVRQRLM